MTTAHDRLTYRAALLVRQGQDTAANVASILLGHSLEEVDQVTLVVGSQLGHHAHIQQYQMRGRWDVEDICDSAPRGVGVHQAHQYVSLQTRHKRFASYAQLDCVIKLKSFVAQWMMGARQLDMLDNAGTNPTQ